MFTTLTFLPDPPISDSPLTYSYILSFPTFHPENKTPICFSQLLLCMGPFLECGSFVRSNGLNENAALGLIGGTIWEGLRGVVVWRRCVTGMGFVFQKPIFKNFPSACCLKIRT